MVARCPKTTPDLACSVCAFLGLSSDVFEAFLDAFLHTDSARFLNRSKNSYPFSLRSISVGRHRRTARRLSHVLAPEYLDAFAWDVTGFDPAAIARRRSRAPNWLHRRSLPVTCLETPQYLSGWSRTRGSLREPVRPQCTLKRRSSPNKSTMLARPMPGRVLHC